MSIKFGNKVHFNWLQLTVFSLGAILSLSMIGYLAYQSFKLDGIPPKLEVVSRYRADLPDYTWRLTVTNRGEETATNANLKFTLYQKGKATESGTVSISYVPIQSEQVGWIIFDRERQKGDSLVLSSITYLQP
ncbi:hypothetical protein [Nafulsella turpanensis]|uniref:hypothetical protein n=1 Tax=Nafulsella turpanensis TaxID=1265690 RepID=UPI00036F6C1B|nr:hypothetical protein [Nafulsella turpanensis]